MVRALLFVTTLLASVLALGPYQPPGNAVRGPCPMLQALANHGEINRDGTFNREQLINALNRNTGMCKGLAAVQFDALWIRDPRLAGEAPPPDNWILSQSHMLTFTGGERDGGIAHSDKIFGSVTAFNATKWAKTVNFSSDGTTMGLWDLWNAHNYWNAQSNADNGRTDAALINAHKSVGAANMGTLWLAFGQKNISIADLTTLMQGRFPANYVKPAKEWCMRDWITMIFILNTGGKVPLDDELLYLACKKAIANISLPEGYQCEFDFTPYVAALSFDSRSPIPSTFPNNPIPTDPGTRTKAFIMGAQFPHDKPDENCLMDAEALKAARLHTVTEYFLATQRATSNYTAFYEDLAPLFVDSNESRIINNAAGIFSTVKIVVEYTALTIPPMNNGFAWFGPPTVVQSSFQYFPNNATIITDNTQLVAFVCSQLPIVNPIDGKVASDGNCESPLIPAAQTTMITFEPCSPLMKQFIVAFDDLTEKMAVYGFTAFRTCWSATKACVGANQQWPSFDACMKYMNTIPTVSCNWLLQGNSVQCRGLHAFLALLDPDVHCGHVGPDSAPCSDANCLSSVDGELLCDDYPPDDIRYDPIKSVNCPSSAGSLRPVLFVVVLVLALLQ